MKELTMKLYACLLVAVTFLAAACQDDEKSGLNLEGNTLVEVFQLDGVPGTISQSERTVVVSLPLDARSKTSLEVTALEVSEGATVDMRVGDKLIPGRNYTLNVSNGDAYMQYTLQIAYDEPEIRSFVLGNDYEASVDNDACTISAFVPTASDLSDLPVNYTAIDGLEIRLADGTLLENGGRYDFSLSPVLLTVTYRTTTVKYTLTVKKTDAEFAPKAFVGIATTVDGLSDEMKAAARWMLENVPNSSYVSLNDVKAGTVRLDKYEVLWCHFDWTDWPGEVWDTRDEINRFYQNGGAILATRDGARYINDVWRIAKDQQSPNNMWGGDGDGYDLEGPWGFACNGHENHPLYEGIDIADEGGKKMIYLRSAGCHSMNRALQWDVNPYGGVQGWMDQTGATPLASNENNEANLVTIAYFAPRNGSGKVITIGTVSFEWFDRNNADNPYFGNMTRLTENAINFLCNGQE